MWPVSYTHLYNILLKDDKHFPYVRVDLNEDFPRVTVVRSVKEDGAKYYGPFIAAHVIRDVLDQVYRLYPLRSCKNDIPVSYTHLTVRTTADCAKR